MKLLVANMLLLFLGIIIQYNSVHCQSSGSSGYTTYPDSMWNSPNCGFTIWSFKNTLEECIDSCTTTSDCNAGYLQEDVVPSNQCFLYDCPAGATPNSGVGSSFTAFMKEPGCLLDGERYDNGAWIHDVCAKLECNETSGQFQFAGYWQDCMQCNLWGDPHFTTYYGEAYSYQEEGDHELSHPAPGSEYPAVWSHLDPCGGGVTCSTSVTFKHDADTQIKMEIRSDTVKNIIDGKTYEPAPSPTTAVNIQSKLFFLKDGNDYLLQGFHGSSPYLVKYGRSRYEVNIYLKRQFLDNQEGLCVAEPMGGRKKTAKQQYQNRCTNDSSFEAGFKTQCIDAINNGNAIVDSDLTQAFIDGCLFDLCNVDDPGPWLKDVVKAKVQEDKRVEESYVAVCSPECVNGKCTATDFCTCSSGWTGPQCQNEDLTNGDDSDFSGGTIAGIMIGSFLARHFLVWAYTF